MNDARDLRPRVGTPQELSERLAYEYARGARHGTPLTLLAVQFLVWNSRRESDRLRLEGIVAEHFMASVRASDGLYDYGLRGCFVGVLPHTTTAEAEVSRERLERRTEGQLARLAGPLRVDVFPVDITTPDVVTLLHRLESYFRTQARVPTGDGGPPPAPARMPLRGLEDFERTLRVELNLAARDASHLSVLTLFLDGAADVPPGLLARHVQEVAPLVLRSTDTVFSVGPSHVAVLMPCSAPRASHDVADRVRAALADVHPDAPYPEPSCAAFELAAERCDVRAVLESMRRVAPLARRAGDVPRGR